MSYRRYVFAVPLEACQQVDSVLNELARESTGSKRTKQTAAFLWLIAAHANEVLATAEALRQSRERSERRREAAGYEANP